MSYRLCETAVITGLKILQRWQLASDNEQRPAIDKGYPFSSFNAAFPIMGRLALTVERANHHPDLVNRYRCVLVCWTSYAEGVITALDPELAAT